MSGPAAPKNPAELNELMGRILADTRFPNPRYSTWGDLRMLALTIVWATCGEKLPAGKARWKRVRQLMSLDNRAFTYLMAEDIPRFSPDFHTMDTSCEAIRPRKLDRCGRPYRTTERVTDPATGEWRLAGFCKDHLAQARQVEAAENARRAAGTIPTPVPNRGGLLACYVPGVNWEGTYRRLQADWEPPEWGVRADDWPTRPGGEPPIALPRLQLLEGDGDGSEIIPGLEPAPPALRVIPGG